MSRVAVVSSLAAALWFTTPASGLAQMSAIMEEAQQVSLISRSNSNPAVAYSENGRSLFVVWDGIAGSSRRIFLREQRDGEWLPPVIVDSNPTGSNSMPTVAVDSTGVPHVAWISQAGEKRQPVYARRISRFPNKWHQLTVPFPSDSSVVGSADLVTLSLDEQDQPWIVWQFGYGNIYSVACTRYHQGDGVLITDELTPGADSHNIFPELFFLPEPTVYWYLAQADQFYLIGAQFNAATGRWQVALPDNFENVPAQHFPDLFMTNRGPLAAIWYDRLTEVDGEPRDRVFMGVGDADTRGRGEVIDRSSDANSHSVAATVIGDQYVAAWVSELYGLGYELNLGIGSSPDSMIPFTIRHSEESLISNPAIVSTDQRAAIAWEESTGPSRENSEIHVRAAAFAGQQ